MCPTMNYMSFYLVMNYFVASINRFLSDGPFPIISFWGIFYCTFPPVFYFPNSTEPR